MKTVKEELRDAIDLNLSQRELCRICGNALAEIKRLEVEVSESIGYLDEMFTSYEEGFDCYEDPDEYSGHLGKAVRLSDESFHKIANILNTLRPRE